MAKQKNKIEALILDYINVLKKKIKLQRVILFGSYAHGKPNKYSDIDLAVFSNDFKDKNEIETMQMLFQLACTIDSRIEPVAFEPNEIKLLKYKPFLREVLKKGKVVYKN